MWIKILKSNIYGFQINCKGQLRNLFVFEDVINDWVMLAIVRILILKDQDTGNIMV